MKKNQVILKIEVLVSFTFLLRNFPVVPVTTIQYTHVALMSQLDGSSVVLCGIEHGGCCTLTKYRAQDFAKLDRVVLKETPHGMAVVTLKEEICVALSYP